MVNMTKFEYLRILHKSREAYARGENISNFLRDYLNESENTDQIIEIAYNLQAGSYVEFYKENKILMQKCCIEIASILDRYLENDDILLDVGSGENTTITDIVGCLTKKLQKTYTLDISLSRVLRGLKFWRENSLKPNLEMQAICGSMSELPFPDKSVDVLTTIHALEPNSKNLSEILSEIFRVTRRKCLLFEPIYESSPKEVKYRMDSFGYTKGLEKSIFDLNATVVDKFLILNVQNKMNPIHCLVVEPPLSSLENEKNGLTVPGTNFELEKLSNFFVSKEHGLLFPEILSVPVLRFQHSIICDLAIE